MTTFEHFMSNLSKAASGNGVLSVVICLALGNLDPIMGGSRFGSDIIIIE